jgi:hypothetical protein
MCACECKSNYYVPVLFPEHEDEVHVVPHVVVHFDVRVRCVGVLVMVCWCVNVLVCWCIGEKV